MGQPVSCTEIRVQNRVLAVMIDHGVKRRKASIMAVRRSHLDVPERWRLERAESAARSVTSPTPPSATGLSGRSPVLAGVGTKKCRCRLSCGSCCSGDEQRLAAISCLVKGSKSSCADCARARPLSSATGTTPSIARTERAPFRSAVPRFEVTKRALEQAGIYRIACEQPDEHPQVLSHFDSALDRLKGHLFEVPGSLVPEESRSLVIPKVDKRHGTPIGERPAEAFACRTRIAEGMRLEVARRTRRPVIR